MISKMLGMEMHSNTILIGQKSDFQSSYNNTI